MSHALSTRLSLALLIALCLFGALPAMAADAPSGVAVTTEAAVSQGASSGQVSLDQFMVPTPEPMTTGPVMCAEISNSYCTYKWNKATWCCYATYTAPGAFCPTICV